MPLELASLAHTVQGAPYEAPLHKDSPDWKLHEPVDSVDSKDADTPDNWVPRHPSILRLTGRHPLNCEPPLDTLMGYGFSTPVSLHYVRNHGAAPKLDWKTHRIEVGGLVESPTSFSMDDLLALPAVTVTCTLVCAGNRRKEENMVKKSIGFNWGPCAVGTGQWTGVRLCDLLRAVGVRGDPEGARYVCFRGPKAELPKGSDGSYGTSLFLPYAMDPANDVLIAYKHNHRWLTPDHGFPVRMLIPGFIGGRMVKWLSEITVTSKESDNFYHFHDNRVLPSHVDDALATKEGWWYKPEYIINDLNVNSAFARPNHNETVKVLPNQKYLLKGYAYSGGGRRVIRVEVSFDDATTWCLANVHCTEKPNAWGKHWCWVFWELEVETTRFLGCKELVVRAWDASMNTQPAVITWNVMGMMNNCYHRIQVQESADPDGTPSLRFVHPAPVENVGWREARKLELEAAEPAPAPPPAASKPTATTRSITMEEVEQHATESSAWFVHEGKVYDATPFLAEHPGGAESILISAGMDATDEFNSIHSRKARDMLAQYYIGDLAPAGTTMGQTDSPPIAPGTPPPGPAEPTAGATATVTLVAKQDGGPLIALDPRKKLKLPLVARTELSHNVRLFRFALPSLKHRLGLAVGKHVFVYASINGENVMRAYTPVSMDHELGYLDLLIKVYYANQHPNFPEGGKLSQHLDAMQLGDTIEVKGPVGHFVYTGMGSYSHGKHSGVARGFSMLAGGTGITPVYQVIRAVLNDPNDRVQLRLIYANQTEGDILLRKELDELAAAHGNFKVWYTLSTAPEGWQYSQGYICEAMCREHLLPAADDVLALQCGPPGMLQNACTPNLVKMGYPEGHIITF